MEARKEDRLGILSQEWFGAGHYLSCPERSQGGCEEYKSYFFHTTLDAYLRT